MTIYVTYKTLQHCALICLLIWTDILLNQSYPIGPEGHFANFTLVVYFPMGDKRSKDSQWRQLLYTWRVTMAVYGTKSSNS